MRRHPLLAFWAMGFLLSWAVWMPLAIGITLPFTPGQAQTYGAYGPALAALMLTLATGGIAGLQQLFGRFFAWRVGWRWYAAALFLPAAISLLSTALNLMNGGDLPDFAHPPIFRLKVSAYYGEWSPWAMLVPVFLQNVLFGTSLGEELAWRGFGLQRLQQNSGALKASLFIGLLWVVWQAPLSWNQVTPEIRGWYFLVLALGAIPAALLMTWLYNNTGGSLLLVLLFNAATKMTDLFVTPSFAPAFLPVISYWLVVALLLTMKGKRALEPKAAMPSSLPVEQGV